MPYLASTRFDRLDIQGDSNYDTAPGGCPLNIRTGVQITSHLARAEDYFYYVLFSFNLRSVNCRRLQTVDRMTRVTLLLHAVKVALER